MTGSDVRTQWAFQVHLFANKQLSRDARYLEEAESVYLENIHLQRRKLSRTKRTVAFLCHMRYTFGTFVFPNTLILRCQSIYS